MAKATNKNDINIFAKRLGDLIKEEGYTHENVAQGIGVTRQGVGKWVSGESVPDVLTAAKLAKFFDVSVDYLAGTSKIKDTNISVKSACEYTSLSESAVLSLGNSYLDEKGMEILSEIIDNESLLDVIADIQMLSEQKDDDIDADLFQLFRYRCSSSSDLIRYSIYRQIGYILDKYDHRKIKGDLDNGKHNPKKE